jgi:hypothetical protein
MSKNYNIKPDCFLEDGTLYVTSPFGKRKDPVTGRESTQHNGVDCVRFYNNGCKVATITALESGVVSACHWGEINNKTYETARGNWVKIDHGNGIVTLYQHLMNEKLVKTGDKVSKGQVIGYMGNTGKSSGTHLHIEVHENGVIVDPLPYLLEEKPIKEGEEMIYNIQIKGKLYQGMKGEEVKLLQMRVAHVSPEYEAEVKSHSMNENNEFDGSFGKSMTQTIKKLQIAAGLPGTGIVDDATRELLNGSILDMNLKIVNAKKALE